MGLYLRKSFRAGPIRFNLSKSGLGISGGVKGARLGVGPSGTYVHAGRHGLYYRKHLSSGQSRTQSRAGAEGCATLLLIVTAVGIGLWFLTWLIDNPAVLVAGIAIAIGIAAVRWSILLQRKKRVTAYKKALDAAFVTSPSPPSSEALSALRQWQQGLPKNDAAKREVEEIETNVYQAVLDKILDDGYITNDEAEVIAAAEQLLRLSQMARLQTKKEIFTEAYIEAIEDREITDDELSNLNNLMAGLAIPRAEVQRELDVVQEIIDAQSLRLPFVPIPADRLAVPIQKNETAFYQCLAQVLSKRKSKDSPSGYEYTVRRDGTMILTNKRVFVVGDGTTNIRFSDIGDVDVDIDEGIIEVSKIGTGRPLILKAKAPIYIGRSIDLLMSAQPGEGLV